MNPCPFCASHNVIMHSVDHYGIYDRNGENTDLIGFIWHVACDECGADGPQCESQSMAETKWNERKYPDGLPFIQKTNKWKEPELDYKAIEFHAMQKAIQESELMWRPGTPNQLNLQMKLYIKYFNEMITG